MSVHRRFGIYLFGVSDSTLTEFPTPTASKTAPKGLVGMRKSYSHATRPAGPQSPPDSAALRLLAAACVICVQDCLPSLRAAWSWSGRLQIRPINCSWQARLRIILLLGGRTSGEASGFHWAVRSQHLQSIRRAAISMTARKDSRLLPRARKRILSLTITFQMIRCICRKMEYFCLRNHGRSRGICSSSS